ncbi:SIMPL domain-containing protein [Metabacillus litoralis]|uniref:SIMPL domain-containing protein n=1 Tax=Metabacillus litoralis TaxID=152268 RepID=UPI00203FF0E2|nr:SIMPL domain-containing protein [Metabacillus litoralis]MCM3651857.1 SIMPL domain-containing protein [Metabacillus litoralis]
MTYFQRSIPHFSSGKHIQGKMILGGTGRKSVIPDQAVINIGIMTENEHIENAQKENSALSNQVIESLEKIGILKNDIQTLSYTIQPIYDFVEGQSIFRAYQIKHIFEVTVHDLNKVATVYEASVAAGANMSGGVRFEVSNVAFYYQEALQLAMKDATDKALKLGQQIGVKIILPPAKITEEPTLISPREVALSYSTDIPLQAAPPIQRSTLEIQAKITVIFHY